MRDALEQPPIVVEGMLLERYPTERYPRTI